MKKIIIFGLLMGGAVYGMEENKRLKKILEKMSLTEFLDSQLKKQPRALYFDVKSDEYCERQCYENSICKLVKIINFQTNLQDFYGLQFTSFGKAYELPHSRAKELFEKYEEWYQKDELEENKDELEELKEILKKMSFHQYLDSELKKKPEKISFHINHMRDERPKRIIYQKLIRKFGYEISKRAICKQWYISDICELCKIINVETKKEMYRGHQSSVFGIGRSLQPYEAEELFKIYREWYKEQEKNKLTIYEFRKFLKKD